MNTIHRLREKAVFTCHHGQEVVISKVRNQTHKDLYIHFGQGMVKVYLIVDDKLLINYINKGVKLCLFVQYPAFILEYLDKFNKVVEQLLTTLFHFCQAHHKLQSEPESQTRVDLPNTHL